MIKIRITNTNALNEMLKRVQHDKKKYVIPNLFRNLDFCNDNKLIAFVLNCFEHSGIRILNLFRASDLGFRILDFMWSSHFPGYI